MVQSNITQTFYIWSDRQTDEGTDGHQKIIRLWSYIFNGSNNLKPTEKFIKYHLLSIKLQMISLAKQSKVGSFEILYRDLFKNGWLLVSVRLSPHSPPTPMKLETWKLVCIILTWIAPKSLSRFLIFCVEVEIF